MRHLTLKLECASIHHVSHRIDLVGNRGVGDGD